MFIKLVNLQQELNQTYYFLEYKVNTDSKMSMKFISFVKTKQFMYYIQGAINSF